VSTSWHSRHRSPKQHGRGQSHVKEQASTVLATSMLFGSSGYSDPACQVQVSANQAHQANRAEGVGRVRNQAPRNQARAPKDLAAAEVPLASRGNGPSPSYCPSPDPRTHPDTIAGTDRAVLEPRLRRPVLPAPNRRPSRKSLKLNADKSSQGQLIPKQASVESRSWFNPSIAHQSSCTSEVLSEIKIRPRELYMNWPRRALATHLRGS
jgi:hypothetical protein